MIRRAIYNICLTKPELIALSAIKPWSGKKWVYPPNQNIIDIKNKIRTQLEAVQICCSFCGLKLYGTSKGEIEHIAAKAYFRYPEFTFTLKNLTLSCHWCNTPEKKGTKETIHIKHKLYSKCQFLLVHPYFDDPIIHFEWTDNQSEILIQVRNNSPKGLTSINMFGLDSPEMNEHRASQVRHEELKTRMPLSQLDEELLENAIK